MRHLVVRLLVSALVATGLTVAAPIASNAVAGCDGNTLLYAHANGTIYRGTKDGTATPEPVYSGLGMATGLAVGSDQTIMWSTYNGGKVYRGTCDGTAQISEVALPAGATSLFQMTYSKTQDKFLVGGSIGGLPVMIAINSDGSNATTVWTGVSGGAILGVGATGDDIYFCNSTFYAATLDGFTLSAPTALYTSNSNGSPAFACDGIAVDTNNGVVYWADYNGSGVSASVWMAPLDGSGTPTVHYAGGGPSVSPSGLVIDFSVEPYALYWGTDQGDTPGVKRGDVDGGAVVTVYAPASAGSTVNAVAIVPNLPNAVADPTVTEVSPAAGSAAGGTELTITGTGFAEGVTVTVGGAECTVSAVTETTITCTTTAHAAGEVDVVVANAGGGQVTAAAAFTYEPINPVVVSASPPSGSVDGGTSLTISGSGFVEGASVTVGGSPCTVTAITETSITCTTTAHAFGLASVVVTNPDGGKGTAVDVFAYTDPPVSTTKKVVRWVFFSPGKSALTKSTLAALGRLARSVPKSAFNVKVHLIGVVQYNGVKWNDKSLAKWRTVMVARHLRSLGVNGKYTVEARAGERFGAKTARRVAIVLTYTVERPR